MNGNIGINVAKLNMKEVENRIDSLKRKKAKKSTYKKKIKKMSSKVPEHCMME